MVRAQPGYKAPSGGGPASARLLPYKRKTRNLEDYYQNFDGRPGYCWCGCGEQTPIRNYTHPQRGAFAGEHAAFLQGHHQRQRKGGQVPPETVEQIRYLWNNSPMASPEIAKIAGLSPNYTRAIAANEVPSYYDPDYTPLKRPERLRLIHGIRRLTCEVCGDGFWGAGPHRNRRVCGEESCFIEYRRRNPPPMTEEVKRTLSKQAKERHASGVYKNARRPLTRAQLEWQDGVPERPEWIEPGKWLPFVLHVKEGQSYEQIAKMHGGTSTKWKQRVARCIEDLKRGGPKPVDNTKKKEAALRRWRNARGEFSRQV